MRDEDLDWTVYRILEQCGAATLDEISDAAGAEPEHVAGSIERLERNLLVERNGERFRLLSINEMILKCQLKYSPGPEIVMENGMIKIKNGSDE